MLYFPGFPKAVKWLLVSNIAVFVVGFFAGLLGLDRPFAVLALVPIQVVRNLFIWQLATYMFLHGGFWHITWNMLALWMFGADLERDWGSRRFVQFYFFCGIGAGICVVLANFSLPQGNPLLPTIGSSGAIFGVLLAYAMMYPDRQILFSFLIPIQAKYFVMIIGVITFMSSFQPGNGVSNFAHLGGLLFGYLFLRTPRMQFDPALTVRRQYREWQLRRARKKFQVYLRKKGSDRDPKVH
jgi:rhomboid family protein